MGVGYAWQTSEIGLAVDNVVGYELVQPSGKIIKVTEAAEPELFWALKVCNGCQSLCGQLLMHLFY